MKEEKKTILAESAVPSEAVRMAEQAIANAQVLMHSLDAVIKSRGVPAGSA